MDQVLMYVLFVVGVVIIVKGGDFFVDAASWIAKITGIPKFVIGATVVSLATTLPEIIVSILAAIEGKVDIAIGNAIGSVNANTGLILAVGMIFMPVAVSRKQFLYKGMIFITTTIAMFLLTMSGSLTVLKSVVLFALFAVFIVENVHSAKTQETAEVEEKTKPTSKEITVNVLKFVFGIAGIVIGSRLLVDYGSEIALSLGVSEKIIAVTAIAIGTSLPELITTITAIVKKESALSFGNIVGANIIDTLLILPICAMISGGALPVAQAVLYIDIPVAFALAVLAVVPTLIRQKASVWQGVVCLAVYLGYIGFTCFA